jgi:hypothetical protein
MKMKTTGPRSECIENQNNTMLELFAFVAPGPRAGIDTCPHPA